MASPAPHDDTAAAARARDWPRLAPRYRAGDWVEVRSAEEILATLDERGCLDGMPFMPEMLQHCGKRLRVSKSAHKTCDTVQTYHNRAVVRSVHLEDLRCDGSAHGGCQAGCLLYWRNAWLKPVAGDDALKDVFGPARIDLEGLHRATRAPGSGEGADTHYACQGTELPRFTKELPWWHPRAYLLDLWTGNVDPITFVRFMALAAWNVVKRALTRDQAYPYVPGRGGGAGPRNPLDLKPGELVQVRSRAEIMDSLGANRREHNLWFDVEMEPFCGKTFRVLRRVEQLLDEKTGRMLRIKRDCVILEGVVCGGCRSRNRLFCPRAIFPYWREVWLKRVE